MNLYKNGYLLHYLISIIVAMTAYRFGLHWAWIIGTVFAVGKEIYDKISKKGTPEMLDFLCSEAGVITGIAIECITDNILEWLN